MKEFKFFHGYPGKKSFLGRGFFSYFFNVNRQNNNRTNYTRTIGPRC